MGTKIHTLFLFLVLVLGMAAYPASINPASVDDSSFNTSFLTAFAEEDEEDERDEDAFDAIQDAIEEIEKAEIKIAEAQDDGKETLLSEAKLEKAKELLVLAETSFEDGNFDDAEDLAEEAEDLASESRMKYLGKSLEDFEEDVDEEINDDESEEESEIEIEVEIEDGTAKIEAEFGDEELEFEMEWIDEQTTIDEIALMTGLSTEEIEGSITFDFDDTEDEENDDERDEELEIEVEVKNDKAKIKIELNDDDYRFVLTDDVSESTIIAAIMDKTGLTEDEITSVWEFEIEDEDQENDSTTQITDTAKTDKLKRHEDKAQENAEETIIQLQQKIDQLEERLQKLLDKFETGEYFGKVADPDLVPDSFVISIDGFASSLDDAVVSTVEGEIFLESIVTASESTKLRITGGEILVGDTFYDFVIGKARLSSSGTSGEKDSMIILGQVMDEHGNVNTIRLSLDGTTSLDDLGSESVEFEINSSRSKIASQWGFDGVGLLSTL